MSVRKLIRKARKAHRCDGCDRPGKIQPGDTYLASTLFPSDDSHNWVRRVPMRFAECAECATRYGRAEMLAHTETHEAVPTGAASVIPTTEQESK